MNRWLYLPHYLLKKGMNNAVKFQSSTEITGSKVQTPSTYSQV